MLLADERKQIIDVCHRMVADDLVVGTAGNVSVRAGELLAITPSGVPYADLRPELISVVRFDDGARVDSPLAPASELELHQVALRATQSGAVVHTHSGAATAVACLEGIDEVPAVHYYAAMFGGAPRVAPYHRYGSSALASAVESALVGRNSALMGNHGAVVTGSDLTQAYDRALYLEWLCDLVLRVSSAGVPRVLPEEEIAGVVEQMKGYGQSAPPADAR
ncbi:class II aldolase/adducin family protein [Mobilicoccus massiliensis]|uniref:class II aldolase/adducin family protein n=1 Tax=Mobilicoccus massiliensis TaxID=1522310 RepID=UPI000590B28E|nr:class II aldolase/adducin family protein [Mobilicoccus massiliensis]